MNVLICGVGGQGILLSSDLLAQAALNQGYDVKKAEVHGMAQRGGSVVSHIRFSKKVASPLIPEGRADFILSFEEMETLRYINFLSSKGMVIFDRFRFPPLSVLAKEADYPEDIEERIKRITRRYFILPAYKIAKELGNPRVQNVIFLGALSHFLDISYDNWKKAIKTLIRPQYLRLNLKAFERGKEEIRNISALL